MSDSILFIFDENAAETPAVLVEGTHTPDALASASGVFIHAAGNAMLQCSSQRIRPLNHWTWFAVESGSLLLTYDNTELQLGGGDSCIFSPGNLPVNVEILQESRIVWIMVGGALAGEFMLKLGAIPNKVMKQGALPTQLNLAKHIVQATVRLQDAMESSSAQLQQLLWAMLATHNGQPVAMDAVLSHEIAKVVDAMRKNQYRDNFSLADMAALSRMPVETFRKRFVSEVGMPPQSYQLFCKMERAKVLLKQGYTVRQSGIEVGMSDPYHFSKAFKNIVGMSPSSYSKTASK